MSIVTTTIRKMLRSSVDRLLNATGYELRRVPRGLGHDAFRDMRHLAKARSRLTAFDVGASIGQTVNQMRSNFDKPVIHSFEPSPSTFVELQKAVKGADVYLNNFALGSEPSTLEFLENTHSSMSSFLEPGEYCWGEIKRRVQVQVSTVDDYCDQHGIHAIDILKCDTQGYELEVLKGASQMLSRNRIHMVYLEINFSEIYKGLPRFDDIYGHLADRGFALVCFYKFHFKKDPTTGWSDALFINPSYESNVQQNT